MSNYLYYYNSQIKFAFFTSQFCKIYLRAGYSLVSWNNIIFKNKYLHLWITTAKKICINASQQEINSLVLKTSPKDNPEIGKALMVLSDPQKKGEYDSYGWKEEWERDWQTESEFRNSIFEAIQNYKHNYNNTVEYTPDGHRVRVLIPLYLDPEDYNLWSPYEKDSGVSWVKKIWGTYGPNWKRELEDFKNKMLAALDKAWEKNKKTPLLDIWEAVEEGKCAECGQPAKLRWKDRNKIGGDKIYCSRDCAIDGMKIKYELPKEFEELYMDREIPKTPPYSNPNTPYKRDGIPNNNRSPEMLSSDRIKRLEKDIENYKAKKQEVPEPDKSGVQDLINELEKQLKLEKMKAFFAQRGETETIIKKSLITGQTTTVKKSNPLSELLAWMKKEGIVGIRLNASGNLVVEYGGTNQVVADNNLTDEQKEVKEFLQQSGQTHFDKNELEEAANQINRETNVQPKNDNGWVAPVIILMGLVIVFLIGIIFYKNKKKKY